MNLLRFVPKLASVWLVIAALVLFALQFVPIPFVNVLGLAGTGLLIQLALIALFVEAVIGLVPRPLLLVPVLAYGTYYAVAITDRTVVVPRRDAELRASNTAHVDFDPVAETLYLTASGIDEQVLIVRYDLVLVLAGQSPLSAVETAAPDECATAPADPMANPQWSRVHSDGVIYCTKRTWLETMPAQGVLKVDMPSTHVVPGVVPEYIERYSFSRNGAEVGAFARSNVAVLSMLPQMSIGCGMVDGFFGPLGCGVRFARDIIAIDGMDHSSERRSGDVLQTQLDLVRVAEILGLVPRSTEELSGLAIR
ncbi:MAG: hypothetical protein ABL879_07945 [Devosia sp.]